MKKSAYRLFNISVKQAAVMLACITTTASSFAWTHAIDPLVSEIRSPLTAQPVNIWRFSGQLGTQIAPNWIVTATHIGVKVNDTYRNSQGSATVIGCFENPTGGADFSDLMICRLNTSIQPPAGTSFPALTANPRLLVPAGTPVERYTPQIGAFLVSGFGNPNFGQQRLVWLDFMNVPYEHDSTVSFNTPPMPYSAWGDSGGGIFWFPASGSEPALTGWMSFGSRPINEERFFTPTSLNWMTQTIASNGGQTLRVRDLSQVQTVTRLSPPAVDNGTISVNTSASQAYITWDRPALATASTDISLYTVTLARPGMQTMVAGVRQTSTGTLSHTFTGIATGHEYSLCVVPVNAAGGAQTAKSVSAASIDPLTGTAPLNYHLPPNGCRKVYASPRPAPVSSITATRFTRTIGSTRYPFIRVTWPAVTAPAGVRMQTYLTRVTENNQIVFDGDVTNTIVEFHETTAGPKTVCATITPVATESHFGERRRLCANLP